MKTGFKPIQTLNQRNFKKNKGRNLVAVMAILMTAIMFTTLFTLAQSMSRNMVEMTFRQTGYDGQASFKNITPEQFSLTEAATFNTSSRSCILFSFSSRILAIFFL